MLKSFQKKTLKAHREEFILNRVADSKYGLLRNFMINLTMGSQPELMLRSYWRSSFIKDKTAIIDPNNSIFPPDASTV